MTQREEIKALREEVAELRKQMSAMAVAMVELAARQPSTIYYQYTPAPQPVLPWPTYPRPWITCSNIGTNVPAAKSQGTILAGGACS